MTEEPNVNSGISGDENKVAIDKAEYDRLMANSARVEKFDTIAEGVDLENAEEYFEVLEQSAYDYDKLKEKNDAPPAAKPPAPASPPTPGATPPQTDPNVIQQINSANSNSISAILAGHFAEYRANQIDLPKEDRSALSKNELTKLVTSKETGGMIVKLAGKKEFGGNVYEAANHYHKVINGIPAAKKEGAASAEALANAKVSGELQTGGETKLPEKPLSPDELIAADNKRRADDIYPDDAPYEMPT